MSKVLLFLPPPLNSIGEEGILTPEFQPNTQTQSWTDITDSSLLVTYTQSPGEKDMVPYRATQRLHPGTE